MNGKRCLNCIFFPLWSQEKTTLPVPALLVSALCMSHPSQLVPPGPGPPAGLSLIFTGKILQL